MSFELEYLSELEVKFESNLGYESGDLVSPLDKETRGQKSHASVSWKKYEGAGHP
jgi:hypothetical protein